MTEAISIVKLSGLTNQILAECWRAIEREGKADRVCVISDPKKWGAEDFIRQVRQGKDVRVVLMGGVIVAMVWIESIRPGRAEVHWHLYQSRLKDMFRIGRRVVAGLFECLNVDLLYGFTPTNNPAAIRYLELIGGKQVGTLPGGSYVAVDDCCVDSAIMAFQRNA